MTRRDPEPGTGSAFMGAAAASFATGPTLILTYGIYAMLADPTASDMDARELGTLGTLIGFSSVICLIGSIPAATLNAIALNHLVHRERDAVWWAMTSGAIVGLLVALIWMTGRSLDRAEQERRAIEGQLRRSLERQHRLLESDMIGVLTANAEGWIT